MPVHPVAEGCGNLGQEHIRNLKKHAALDGVVTFEEAEALQRWLKNHPQGAVNLAKCQHLHASVLRVLLSMRPKVHVTSQTLGWPGFWGATAVSAQVA
jgi:hypothetical protein